jgi:hypothetical protein
MTVARFRCVCGETCSQQVEPVGDTGTTGWLWHCTACDQTWAAELSVTLTAVGDARGAQQYRPKGRIQA